MYSMAEVVRYFAAIGAPASSVFVDMAELLNSKTDL